MLTLVFIMVCAGPQAVCQGSLGLRILEGEPGQKLPLPLWQVFFVIFGLYSSMVIVMTVIFTFGPSHSHLVSFSLPQLVQSPLLVFMKGTPQQPMCGFSRAVMQVLQLNNVDTSKITTVNVLEDEEMRTAMKEYS